MTQHDVDRIQRVLGVSLPDAYCATMLAYPFPPEHQAAELWMPDDVDIVLELNRAIRQLPLANQPWPTHLVIIGDDGGEEAFVLDTRTASGPVLVYERESSHLRSLAPDCQTWLATLRDWQAEVDRDAAAMREAYARKRWWQLWIPRDRS